MDDAASAASLDMSDGDFIELMKNVSIWFNEHGALLSVPEDNSDISTERTLSQGDDGYHYRGEQLSASKLSEASADANQESCPINPD
jgi:hypothetical protein